LKAVPWNRQSSHKIGRVENAAVPLTTPAFTKKRDSLVAGTIGTSALPVKMAGREKSITFRDPDRTQGVASGGGGMGGSHEARLSQVSEMRLRMARQALFPRQRRKSKALPLLPISALE
jgi:hypothetical protein